MVQNQQQLNVLYVLLEHIHLLVLLFVIHVKKEHFQVMELINVLIAQLELTHLLDQLNVHVAPLELIQKEVNHIVSLVLKELIMVAKGLKVVLLALLEHFLILEILHV